ncbi:MAG: LysE family transporter [Chitinophagaceae bacterium]|jgi:threonine/homoserine/homoserine lactone efflux protein|nr:LysE family transporter [Chitinophagaceae bacterium]
MDLFVKGIGLGLLLSVSVGPIVFAILKVSMKLGHKAGYAFVTGVSLSDLLLVLLGNLAAELVRTALRYESWIAAGGAILLIIMGAYSFFFGKDPREDSKTDIAVSVRRRDMARYTLQGFFMNLLNPGPILFWLTTCTAFAFLPLEDRALLFGTCLGTILATDLAKVYFAGRIRRLLTPATLHKIHQFSALVLIGFGAVILIRLFYLYMT